MIDVGTAIAKVRKKRGYSQDKLAQMLGCTKQTISNYERGTRKPGINMLEKLSEVLQEPVTTFVSDLEHYVPDDDPQEDKPGGEKYQDKQEHSRPRPAREINIEISGDQNGKGIPENISIRFGRSNIRMYYQGKSDNFSRLYCQMSRTAKKAVIWQMMQNLQLTDQERFNMFTVITKENAKDGTMI